MLITAYASGSSGNVYMINDGSTRLLMECGLPYNKLQQLAGLSLTGCSGVLITHEHMDHARAAAECVRRGWPVYGSPGTLEALMLAGRNVHPAEPYQWFQIGTLHIQAFEVYHDVAQPVGYVIFSERTGERLVFATDTYKLPHTFPGATELAIECNHTREQLLTADIPDSLRLRIKRNHMSLDACRDFLKATDLSQVQRIMLLHLSEERGDAVRFQREIAALTGRKVVIA